MKYRLLSSMFYEDKELYQNTYITRFQSESTYRFNFKIGEHHAFVVIHHDILQSITSILKLNHQLSLKADTLPGIALKQFTKKCLIDEIKMTNEIEGVISTRKEISEILDDLSKNSRLYGLVKKYELLTEEDIALKNCTDIRILYNELVLNEVADDNIDHIPDGLIFRKDPVYVQSKTGKTLHTGLNPESKIIETMTECLSIIDNEHYNPFISAAVFHYMFGHIHPFYDGNGRISRFISSYLLSRELHPLIAYRLAYTIKKDINRYYKNFDTVNDPKNKGEITSFVQYFLHVLTESLEELNYSLSESANKLAYYENEIQALQNSNSQIDERVSLILYLLVQNKLFGESELSVYDIVEITHLSHSKVRNSLNLLEQMALITSSKSGRKHVYEVNLNNWK